MTNSKLTKYGHVIMDVAVHLRGRTPIASAVLKNGLGKVVHVYELQDGDCVIVNRNSKHPKCSIKNGEMTKADLSSFVSSECRKDSLKSITSTLTKVGYQVTSDKRTGNLPLLQTPIVFADNMVAAA